MGGDQGGLRGARGGGGGGGWETTCWGAGGRAIVDSGGGQQWGSLQPQRTAPHTISIWLQNSLS